MKTYIITALFCLLPISELRGAIPYALSNGLPLWLTYIYCVSLNFLVAPILFFFLTTLHKVFIKIDFYKNLFDKFIIRARHKVEDKVKKYGYLGIMIFVAIPLPITGAYTGTLGAWILGLSRKKTCIAVAGGVAIAGIIVSAVSILGIEALSFLTKHIGN